jgi:hypothetical protein
MYFGSNQVHFYKIVEINRKYKFPPRRSELEWWCGEFPDFPPDIFFADFCTPLFIDFIRMTRIFSYTVFFQLFKKFKCAGSNQDHFFKIVGAEPSFVKVLMLRFEELGSFVIIFAFAVFSGMAKILFHHAHVLSSRIPESW